jgi:hypothetical protein
MPPLSPLIFLLVAKGLSRAFEEAKFHGEFQGIPITPNLKVTHLLFVDDVLILCNGLRGDAEKLSRILEPIGRTTRMLINERKSTLSVHNMDVEEMLSYKEFFPYEQRDLDDGLKYMGFQLKPNKYRKEDWIWLLAKLEKRLKVWSFKWLSRVGRLALVKSVL